MESIILKTVQQLQMLYPTVMLTDVVGWLPTTPSENEFFSTVRAMERQGIVCIDRSNLFARISIPNGSTCN